MISRAFDRPTSVTVIGWFWVIVGTLVAFHACLGVLFVSLVLNEAHADPAYASEMPIMLATVTVLALCAVLAATSAACGIAFLKLKPWSRLALEAFALLSVALLLYSAFWWASAVIADKRSPGPISMLVGLVVGELIITGAIVPLALIIRSLRGDVVKMAMRGSEARQG
jgi:hypothetical protein